MSKYEPLRRFLEGCATEEVLLTFGEIERILGSGLPASKSYPAWWSNNPSNNVMTRAWLAAGYRSERVDIAGEKLVFRRDRANQPTGVSEGSPLPTFAGKPGVMGRLRSALGGTVHIAEGVDLTQPTGEVWDADR